MTARRAACRPGGAPAACPGRAATDITLAKIVYDEALRLLEGQRDELTNVRNRTVGYLALVATATSFLVGTGLKGAPRTAQFWVPAGVGTVLFTTTLLLGLQVLVGRVRNPPPEGHARLLRFWSGWSTPELTLYLSPTVLSEVVSTPSRFGGQQGEAGLLHALARQVEKHHDTNEVVVGRLKDAYVRCVALGFLQLLVWGAIVWVHGRVPIA